MGFGNFLKKVVSLGAINPMAGMVGAGVMAKKASNAKATANRNAYDQLAQDQINQAQKSQLDILKKQPGYQSALDTAESQKFKNEAYGSAPLAEYESMRGQAGLANTQQQQKLQQGLSDEMQNQSLAEGGAQANAYSQLAQGGGLSGGARERIAGGLGQQSLQARQAARLQTQRAGTDLESGYQQQLMGLTGKEAADRRGMQNAYLGMQATDVGAKSSFGQSQYDKEAAIRSGAAKAKQDLALAQAGRK